MLAPIVIADTSALVKILDADLEHLLPRAFWRILLPRHVETELKRKGKSRRAKLKRLLDAGVVEHCHDYFPGLVGIWHASLRRTQGNRDRGEAEALAQCQSRAVHALFVHDLAARKLADGQGWRVITPAELLAAVGDR
jgi:predicted nucleic acid-binding protein